MPAESVDPVSAEQPSQGMVIWWNLLRPDRLAIADMLDEWARDYAKAEAREGAQALRDAARMIRASAGGPDV